MKETLDDECLDMIREFVKDAFPKKRLRLHPKHKNFKRVIVIPPSLNEGTTYVYQMADKTNLGILFMLLYDIVKDVFYGFDIESINTAIYEHLGIKHD